MPSVAISSVALGRPTHSFVSMVTLRDRHLFWQYRFPERHFWSAFRHVTNGDLTIGGLAMIPFILRVETGIGMDDHEH
jgi:hypothetical protein